MASCDCIRKATIAQRVRLKELMLHGTSMEAAGDAAGEH